MGQKLHDGVAAVTIMMHFHSHISSVTAPLFNPIFLKCEGDPIFLGKNIQGPIWVVLSSQLFHRMLARSGSRFRAVGRGVRYTHYSSCYLHASFFWGGTFKKIRQKTVFLNDFYFVGGELVHPVLASRCVDPTTISPLKLECFLDECFLW